MKLNIEPAARLHGTLTVPGDKSISHRAVMLGALAHGSTHIRGFLPGQDCLHTIQCLRQLGVDIEIEGTQVVVKGQGLDGLQEPQDALDVGNSGTTIRLMSGILAGQPFTTTITGDGSICRRPMGRITKPLQQMGAHILGREQNTLAPLTIRGGKLRPIHYHTPVASAQVKSAVLLAGLYVCGQTHVTEPATSRNHTELMLQNFGAKLSTQASTTTIQGRPILEGQKVQVPGDLSAAAFFIVAAAIVPNAEVTLTQVGLNPTRTGLLDTLTAMGANITIDNVQNSGGERRGDITVKSSSLKGINVGGETVLRMIDEIPILAVAAAYAEGVTQIRDAAELKVKESNRLQAIAQELAKMGAAIEELPDGLGIKGGKRLNGAVLDSHGDHRIAMALSIAGLMAKGQSHITNAQVIDISFPGFKETLDQLLREDERHVLD